jgi:hypothetical protein
MLRRLFSLVLLLLVCTSSNGQDSKKWPIPSKEAQAKIETLLKEIYQKEFTKAQADPMERGRLAQTMLAEGRETKDDAAGRYVLLLNAHNLAAQAGDVTTALAAADELAQSFVIPASTIFGMKIKMLQQASKVEGAAPDAYQSVIDRALVILDDTLDADDYPSSVALINAAEQAARKMRSIALVVAMRKKQAEVERLQKEFQRWQPFADRLAKNPKDAAANFELGKYQALVKGNWERGLPMLIQGKGALQALAGMDLATTKANSGQLAVATRWQAAADTLDPTFQTQARLRAYYWYQQALNDANEKTRPTIEVKLKEIADSLPPEYRIGEITTELKKIDMVGPVYGCAFTPDARRFIATGYDGTLRVFNTKTYKEVGLLEGHAGKVFCVDIAVLGHLAVSGGFDSTVRLWNLDVGRVGQTFEGHKDYVRSVAISTDSKWVLSGGDDRTVRLWNVAAGKLERVLTGHDHTVWGVALSHDGKRALSASLDKTVRLWDLEKGETIRKLEGHKDTVLCVAFAPDGRHAVTGSTDKTIRVWDLNTGKTVMTLEGSAGYIHSVAVSPDGRRILSAGADNAVRLWDAVAGKEIRKLEGHRDQVWHVAFSRDGRLAISGGQDSSVRLWK